MFLFFFRTQCPTEIVSSWSNTYSCRSLSNDWCLLAALVMYRSPSQNNDQFEKFLSSFEDFINEITISNPLFYLTLGDFNARSPTWWDDKISIEGMQLYALTLFNGLHQVIKEPTHLMECSASCIDLTFTNQPNLVIYSGVHQSLHTVITK